MIYQMICYLAMVSLDWWRKLALHHLGSMYICSGTYVWYVNTNSYLSRHIADVLRYNIYNVHVIYHRVIEVFALVMVLTGSNRCVRFCHHWTYATVK